jgi:hypothetical protein
MIGVEGGVAAAATAVAAGVAKLDTVVNAWQVAVSTRRLAAGSMSSLKCLKKSTPIIGNDTAASRKDQVNFLLLNCKEIDLSPQQGISLPAGPKRVGPVGTAFEENG